jgi:Icc-related predicted phosphoesterase
MRILPFSDIHLETTRGWDLPPLPQLPPFDVAVIAGDLTTRMERGVKWIKEHISKPCLYIPGNHEPYGVDLDVTVAKARAAAIGTNVLVASNDAHSICGVDFFGCTLWTDFNLFGDRHVAMTVAGDRMNDFRGRIRIDNYRRKFRPADALARHNESVAFLKTGLARSKASRQVVVTHHKPIATDGNLRMPDGFPDVIQAAYCCSDLGEFFVDGPTAWVFGHTHESLDITVGRTRLISNAKGYGPWDQHYPTHENKLFDPFFVFDI